MGDDADKRIAGLEREVGRLERDLAEVTRQLANERSRSAWLGAPPAHAHTAAGNGAGNAGCHSHGVHVHTVRP